MAFDKANGKVLWTALDDKIGYSTPREVTIDGVSQIIVLMGEALVSVSPKDGKEYWRQEWKTELDANVATPVVSGNRLFISTGYSTGCALFELSVKDGKPAAEKLWANKEMKNYFSTSVLVDGYLYGFNNNKLTCLDFRTGKTRWKTGGFNRGSLIAADGKLIIYGDQGLLALAEISPDSYKELAKFKFCDERTWTVPTLSGGRLFLRNEKELACLKVGSRGGCRHAYAPPRSLLLRKEPLDHFLRRRPRDQRDDDQRHRGGEDDRGRGHHAEEQSNPCPRPSPTRGTSRPRTAKAATIEPIAPAVVTRFQ